MGRLSPPNKEKELAQSNLVRVTSFVPTRKPGMLIGPCKQDSLEALIAVIKQAQAENKGITFMLFENAPNPDYPDRKSVASLTVAVERDRPAPGGGPGRRPIGNAPRSGGRPDPLKGVGLFGGNAKQAEQTEGGSW